MLGLRPEAAAGRLGSGAAARPLRRLLLVEGDGHRRVVEVEEPGELLNESCRDHASGLSSWGVAQVRALVGP